MGNLGRKIMGLQTSNTQTRNKYKPKFFAKKYFLPPNEKNPINRLSYATKKIDLSMHLCIA